MDECSVCFVLRPRVYPDHLQRYVGNGGSAPGCIWVPAIDARPIGFWVRCSRGIDFVVHSDDFVDQPVVVTRQEDDEQDGVGWNCPMDQCCNASAPILQAPNSLNRWFSILC